MLKVASFLRNFSKRGFWGGKCCIGGAFIPIPMEEQVGEWECDI